jgi:chromosome segregation ATPase
MCKKLLIAAVVVGAAVLVFKGTRLAGYAKEEIASLKHWVESKVPPEREIARLRKEVAALDKDIDAVKGKLAREIVECRYIKEDADKLRTRVDAEQARLIEVGDQIKAATEQVKYGTRTVNAALAKEMLKADVQRHMTSKKNLEGMEAGLASREKIKAILEAQLEELKAKKFELASAVDAAEVELKDLQLKQMESKYQFDDTRLAGIKESLRELQKNIAIKREELKMGPPAADLSAPTTGSVSGDTVDEILAPLTTKTGSKGSN